MDGRPPLWAGGPAMKLELLEARRGREKTMSTLVMVKRGAEACMAAETLTSWGSMKQRAGYVSSPEKIFAVGDAYIGVVGWSVIQTVLQSAFASGCALP